MNGSSGQSTSSTIPNTIKRAELFLELCQVVQKHWLLIVKTPARDVQLIPQVVDVSQSGKPLSASLVQRVCQRPGARRVEALYPSETLNTAENRYIAFVFDKILKDKHERIAEITEYIEQLNREHHHMEEGFDQNEIERLRNRFDARHTARSNSIAKMNHLQESIDCVVGSIELWRRSKLLRDLKPSLPELPSLRLMQSDEYGPVFEAFCRYSKEISTFFVPLKIGLETALTRMTLRPSWQFYERWLLLEIYGVLVEQFGFRPVKNNDGKFHPLEYIDVVHDELSDDELAGKSFALQFNWSKRDLPVIDVCLHYDKQVNDRFREIKRPDIRLIFTIRGEKPQNNKVFRFAVDAKYRKYCEQGNRCSGHENSIFHDDVINVSKKKYLDRIDKITASFIMHSDTEDYTFWGGEIGFDEIKLPNHRYGAVGVKPGDSLNVVRLIKCFLMYHMKCINICWSCRQKSEQKPVRNNTTLGQIQGVFDHECPDCPRVWTSAWCDYYACNSARYHHPDSIYDRNLILKLGEHSFHSPSVDVEGQFRCPHCGSVRSKKKHY